MSRVIAVQEEQLKLLRENYNKNVANVVQSNANALSESLGGTSDFVSAKPIDMETQSVNMNAFAVPPINPVVSSEATNEVFGATVDVNVPTSNFEQPNVTTSNENLPYQEPLLNTSAPVNVMSDESFVNYINSLRNMLSDFMNDMNSKLDKLQEEFLSKTGANLLIADSASEVKSVEPVNVQPVSNVVTDSLPVTNIFDPNETLVTNNLIQDINEARGMVESGFSKAA